ncbi:MAG: tetratricopeptide repeat protein [Caulobacteraceae bacterium]
MCRNLTVAATLFGLLAATDASAFGFGKKPADPAKAAAAGAQAAATAQAPRRSTDAQRAEAERLDPLARAAFWSAETGNNPTDVTAGIKLAAALRSLGQHSEAAQAAGRVLVMAPRNLDALLEAARAHLAAGQGFYAIEPLKTAAEVAPRDWRPLSLLGVAYDQVNRGADAETAWRQALALSPDNPAVLSNLAMHRAAQGDLPGAEQMLRTASVQPGATIQQRQNLALVLGLEGKLAEAEALTRQNLPPELADNNIAYLKAAAGR